MRNKAFDFDLLGQIEHRWWPNKKVLVPAWAAFIYLFLVVAGVHF